MNKESHKSLLISSLGLCLLTSIFFLTYQYHNNKNHKINYINNSYLNLDNHLYFSSASKNKTILLGSSAASGNNIPVSTTIVDFMNSLDTEKESFFNMGLMEATLIDSMAILADLKADPPKRIIYAFNPGNFRSLYGNYSLKNSRALLPFLPSEVRKALEDQAKRMINGPLDDLLGILNLPSPLLLKTATALYHLRLKLFGPQFNKNFFQLRSSAVYDFKSMAMQLDLLMKLSESMGSTLSFYFEPINFIDNEDKEKYRELAHQTKNYLKKRGYHFKDYSEFFRKDPEYFLDFVHLTPKGNSLLANELFKELENAL